MDELKPCPNCESFESGDFEDEDGKFQKFNFCPICGKPFNKTGKKILAARRAAPENKAKGECVMDAESKRIFDALYDLHDRYDEDPKHMICAEAADYIKSLSKILSHFIAAPENKPLTKADRIRSMSDEELAGFIQSNLPIFRTYGEQLDWLGQPYARKPEGSEKL